MEESKEGELSAAALFELLEKGEDFFLFDVRNQEEFERWRIEGKGVVPALNIPYFDLIEKGGKEDFQESIRACIQSELSSRLPKEKKMLVVCAKGGTSAIVAAVLKTLGYEALNLSGGMEQWGNFCAKKLVVKTPDFSIFQFIRPSRGCLSYVIVSGQEAIVIDPLRNLQPYVDLFEELKVSPLLVLDTHAHADHISGGKALADRYSASYFLHPYDGIHPMDLLPAKFSYEPSWPDKVYLLGKVKLQALHIPGHTLGNQAFLLNGKYLFTGDSIFIRSIARPDLGGQASSWTDLHFESLRKLLMLPDETRVLPAHFSTLQEADADQVFSASLGELKQSNEGLVMAQKSLAEFRDYILANLPKFPKEYIEIKRINIGLVSPDEQQAAELELGKNICAMKR